MSFPFERENRSGVTHFTVPLDVMQQLRVASPCCKSISQFPYKDLAVDTTIQVGIDSSAPVYDFKTGKSFFSAFKLPVSDQPFNVTIKSYFSGYAFYPKVLVLDDKYGVTREVSRPTIRYMSPGWIERGRVEGTIAFKSAEVTERYIVIHTTDELMNEVVHSSKSGYGYATAAGPVFVPGGTYANHFGPVGTLEITVTTDKNRQ